MKDAQELEWEALFEGNRPEQRAEREKIARWLRAQKERMKHEHNHE